MFTIIVLVIGGFVLAGIIGAFQSDDPPTSQIKPKTQHDHSQPNLLTPRYSPISNWGAGGFMQPYIDPFQLAPSSPLSILAQRTPDSMEMANQLFRNKAFQSKLDIEKALFHDACGVLAMRPDISEFHGIVRGKSRFFGESDPQFEVHIWLR